MAMTSKITDMILTAFLALGPVKAENDRLDKLDAEDKKETDGWRIGTRIRKGKDKQQRQIQGYDVHDQQDTGIRPNCSLGVASGLCARARQ